MVPKNLKGGLERLKRVYGYAFAAVFSRGLVIINRTKKNKAGGYFPSVKCLRAAERFTQGQERQDAHSRFSHRR
jgi:hypothetical protein